MSIVFDASALLVLLNKEPGYKLVEQYVPEAIMSAVNLAEVITVLMGAGVPSTVAVSLSSELMTEIVPFDVVQAATSAALRQETKPYGLSLGDRACLALAQQKKLSVLTADKIWGELKLTIDIKLVR
jgi:PIN domain nuclease of toxin-antitoxin system